MFEKLKKIFTEKDVKRRNENLVAFLIILVITLIVINKILSEDENDLDVSNETGVELVTETTTNVEEVSIDSDLKTELEDILSKINGVRESTSIINIFGDF